MQHNIARTVDILQDIPAVFVCEFFDFFVFFILSNLSKPVRYINLYVAKPRPL